MNIEKLKECLIFFVLRHSRKVQRTKLVKLVYLSDLLSYARRGRTITSIQYINYDHGPWSRLFYTALSQTPEISDRIGLTPFGDVCYTYSGNVGQYKYQHLTPEDIEFLEKVDDEWGKRNLRDVLAHTYATEPFKQSRFGDTLDFDKAASHRQP